MGGAFCSLTLQPIALQCDQDKKVVTMMNPIVRSLLLPGALIGIGIALTGCPIGGGGPAFFADKALESAVRAELGKPLGILSANDLLSVTEISASALNIRNLSGIEGCRNLTVLDLHDNMVRSITPLENLVNLRVLDLSHNEITQISAISGLFLLEELNLAGPAMAINDWSPLAANATNGGLGADDVVVLPAGTTLDSEGNVLDYWLDDFQTLINLGVDVLFEASETGGQ